MKSLSLISLGIGAVAGTGVALSYYYSSSTIKEYIEANKKSNNKIFITSKTPNLTEIQERYKDSKRDKPKENGKNIEYTKLGEWCEKAVNDKFIDESKDNYKGIISWCYININSFEEQIKLNGNKKLSTQEATHKDWTDAWVAYKSGRDDAKLKITDTAKQQNLNGEDQTNGATALRTWCNEKTKIKLYFDDAEEEFNRFNKWCAKVKAS